MSKQLLKNIFKLNIKKINKIKATVALTLILSIFTGTLKTFAENMHLVRVVIDGDTNAFRVGNIKVSDLFYDKDIILHEKDIVDTDLDFVIKDDMVININTAENIIFDIEGEGKQNFVSNGGAIAIALKEFEKETKRLFKLKEGQSPAKEITQDMVINVIPYVEKIKILTEKVPFETTYVENPDLLQGKENVKTEGLNGSKQIKTREIYINDKLQSSEIMSETIVNQPVNKVIEKGTKKPEVVKPKEQPKKSYVKKIKMKSTAYTAGAESTGKNPGDSGYGVTASGMKAKRGVVAVDTSVIPFGTKLYIEGYGYAVAGDTGGAIKGNKVDVFLDTYKEAINWGVRHVDVYILE